MRESDPLEGSVVVTFAFENQRFADRFAEDTDDFDTVLPLQPESLARTFDDALAIGRTMRFREQGSHSIALRFEGSSEAISEVYELAQRHGGRLQGFLDGAPEPIAHAFELALERGWNPGMPELHRMEEPSRPDEPAEFRRPYAQLRKDSAEDTSTGAGEPAPAVADGPPKGGKRSLPLYVAIFVALVSVASGLIWLKVARFGAGTGPGGADSPGPQSATENSALRAQHAMTILQDAARLLPGRDEGILGKPLESTEMALWINGTSVSRWNPDLLMLGPDLENLAIDPWGNAFRVRFDNSNGATAVRIWSMGPDGIENDGTGDDIVLDPAPLVSGSGAGGTSKVIDLLSPSVKGADDAIGDWTREGNVPISPGTGEYSSRPFAVAVPESFEARFTVERRSGDHAFIIGYPARGKRVTSLLDLPLQNGKETLRGVGIGHIVKRSDEGGNAAQLLPKGARREVYVRVEPGAITTGVREGVDYSWNRGDDELDSFPEPLVKQADGAPLFIGSWNSSFAIHSAELIDLGAGSAVPPPRPPVLLPPVAEFPRSGTVALGWSDLGEAVDAAPGKAPVADPDPKRTRIIAITLEVDNSDWTPTGEALAGTGLFDGKSMRGLERSEYVQIGSFSIRVGGEVSEVAGVARSPSTPPSKDDGLEWLGLGEPLGPVNGAAKSVWQIHRTREFVVVHADPVDRAGRMKITLWSQFSPSDGIRPVHVKGKDGEWLRVPDRPIDPF